MVSRFFICEMSVGDVTVPVKMRKPANFAALHHRARAIGIVKIQNGSLNDRVRRTHAGRMIRVALELGGAAFVAFYQNSDGIRAKRHGGRVEIRLAQDHAVGLLHVRDNVGDIGTPAAGHTGEGQRGAH
jgi:hypothetical protein